MYSRLAYEGLISTTYQTEEGASVLLPEMQFSYAVLDWRNLHFSGRVRTMLRRSGEKPFLLTVNRDFPRVIKAIQAYHSPCWLTPEYTALLEALHREDHPFPCRVVSVELWSPERELVAGEAGYQIGAAYTSLSGFCNKEKAYAGSGTLQMVLLGSFLHKKGFDFWNMGHPGMDYKSRLGAKTIDRAVFLRRWKKSRVKDCPLLEGSLCSNLVPLPGNGTGKGGGSAGGDPPGAVTSSL